VICFQLFKREREEYELWLFPYLKVNRFSPQQKYYVDKSKSIEQVNCIEIAFSSYGIACMGLLNAADLSKFTLVATWKPCHYVAP